MRKVYKILVALCFLFMIFILTNKVQANSINSLTMDIYINKEGKAYVKEIWNTNSSDKTEWYHTYKNLGESEIMNLSVKDEKQTYTTISNWNVKGSFNDKKYKAGINRISNGIEICFGISNYGTNTHEVTYEITNFVSELIDAQMIYWNLIDFEMSISEASIKIYSDDNFPQTIDVWGYGKYGAPCYVYDGYIEMTTDGKRLNSNEYMVILAKFPLDTFNLNNKLDYNFEHYLNMSEQGSIKYVEGNDGSGISYSSPAILSGIIMTTMIFIVCSVTFVIVSIINFSSYKFREKGKKVPRSVPYFRDIPCRKDIFRAFFIANQYYYSGKNIIKGKKTNFFGTVLLKWLKEGKIKIEKRMKGLVVKKEETCIILDHTIKHDVMVEAELYSMLCRASGDGVLEPKEFEKYCRTNYSIILGWFDNAINYQRNIFIKEGTIKEEKYGKWFTRTKYYLDDSIFEEACELVGLKKFLKDYSLIHEREPIEVSLFEEYLMFAQMMGIAKKVAKDFEKLYPDVIQDYNNKHNYSYSDIMFIHTFSTIGMKKAVAAKSAAEAARSYSGGGGGFSSGGGGGGSFGGGRRRFTLKNI